MKNRWIIFCFIISLMFNIAFLGSFGYRKIKQISNRPETSWKERRKQYFMDEYSLTEDQAEKMNQIREEFITQIKDLRTLMIEESKSMANILLEAEPDSLKIEDHLNRIGKLHIDFEREVVRQLLKEKEVLGPGKSREYFQRVVDRLGKRGHGRRTKPKK